MEERITRGRFVRLGAALGVSAAGASALAACEGGGGGAYGGASGDGEDGGGTGDTGGEAQSPGGGKIAQESEVAEGTAVKFTDSGEPAILIHLQSGDFAAYSAVCTHQQCTVAYKKDSGKLACPCHGSVYDPADGAKVVGGPAPRPLPEIPIEVQNGEIVKA